MFCGGDKTQPYLRIGKFQIVKCFICGLVFTNPRLPQKAMSNVYNESYFKSKDSLVHGYEDYALEKPNIQRSFKKRWDHLLTYSGKKKGRLLDVGCAYGFLLELAQECGWTAFGLDTSRPAVSYATKVLKLNVKRSDLSTIPFPNASFDVIVLWDTIEHMPNPFRRLIVSPSLGSQPAARPSTH